jgi:hypothetical protein
MHRSKTFRKNCFRAIVAAVLMALTVAAAQRAWAHCDTLSGPVVTAARRALQIGDVNYVLIWVQARDEAEVRHAFEQTMAVRRLGPTARDLADEYFFETVVRLHRADEGAPYVGLKTTEDLGPAIPAADRAIAEGASIARLNKLLSGAMQAGLRKHFEDVMEKRQYQPDDLAAGRRYVRAYVEYVHYVERLYEAAMSPAHGHYAEPLAAKD